MEEDDAAKETVFLLDNPSDGLDLLDGRVYTV